MTRLLTRKLRSGVALALSFAFFASCSQIIKSDEVYQSDRGSAADSSASDDANASLVTLDVSIPGISATGKTNKPEVGVIVSMTAPRFSEDTQKYVIANSLVEIEIMGPTGRVLVKEAKTAGNVAWSFALDDGDGEYSVVVTPVPSETFSYTPPPPQRLTFVRDSTPPVLALTAQARNHTESGERFLSVHASLDSEDAICGAAHVSVAGKTDVEVAEVELIAHAELPNTFYVQNAAIRADLENTQVRVSCADSVGNRSTVAVLAAEEHYDFSLAVAAVGESGIPVSGEDSLLFIGSAGKVPLILSLVNNDAQALAARLVEKHKSEIKLYFVHKANDVTIAPPTGMEDILDPYTRVLRPWVSLPREFASSVDFVIPMNVYKQRQQRIYVVMTRTEVEIIEKEDGTRDARAVEKFYGAHPVDFMWDTVGASLTWTSGPQYEAPTLNKTISLAATISRLEGAPIKTIHLESSTDNSTWAKVAGAQVNIAENSAISVEFPYPFADERDYRVRLRVVDVAGNAAISRISPNLVGRGLAVRQVDGNCSQKAKIAARIMRSFICRPAQSAAPDFPVAESDVVMLPLALYNNGGVRPTFSSSAATVGYFVHAGSVVAWNPQLPHAVPSTQYDRASPRIFPMWNLSSLKSNLPMISLQNLELNSAQVNQSGTMSLILDVEPFILEGVDADAVVYRRTSTTNACYEESAAPHVVLWNQKPLPASVFPCDSVLE